MKFSIFSVFILALLLNFGWASDVIDLTVDNFDGEIGSDDRPWLIEVILA